MDFDPKEIIELEHQTWRALSTDGPSFLRFVSDEVTMLLPGGMIVTLHSKPTLEEIMTSEHFVPWKQYSMSHVEVMQPAAHVAIISYKVKASRGGSDKGKSKGKGKDRDRDSRDRDDEDIDDEFRALMSTTWKYETAKDKWLMCFHQQSPY